MKHTGAYPDDANKGVVTEKERMIDEVSFGKCKIIHCKRPARAVIKIW